MKSPQKTKKLLPALATVCFVLSVLLVPAVAMAKIQPQAYWEVFTYTKNIPAGEGLCHLHTYEGALEASAQLVSSTGECDFYYVWNPPTLEVYIDNLDNKKITVKWKEYFLVN